MIDNIIYNTVIVYYYYYYSLFSFYNIVITYYIILYWVRYSTVIRIRLRLHYSLLLLWYCIICMGGWFFCLHRHQSCCFCFVLFCYALLLFCFVLFCIAVVSFTFLYHFLSSFSCFYFCTFSILLSSYTCLPSIIFRWIFPFWM